MPSSRAWTTTHSATQEIIRRHGRTPLSRFCFFSYFLFCTPVYSRCKTKNTLARSSLLHSALRPTPELLTRLVRDITRPLWLFPFSSLRCHVHVSARWNPSGFQALNAEEFQLSVSTGYLLLHMGIGVRVWGLSVWFYRRPLVAKAKKARILPL